MRNDSSCLVFTNRISLSMKKIGEAILIFLRKSENLEKPYRFKYSSPMNFRDCHRRQITSLFAYRETGSRISYEQSKSAH